MSTAIDKSLRELKEKGYTRIEGQFDEPFVNSLRSRIKELQKSANDDLSGHIPFLNRGHDMIYNLQNKDICFIRPFLSHPIICGLLGVTLNDEWYRGIPAGSPNYILRSLLARSGGAAAMPLHIDSFVPGAGAYAWSLQVAIILEKQTEENGCTIAVPGSHRFDRYADQASVKDAVAIPSEPGDIVAWDSRLWHGTRANPQNASRWSVIGTFGRWWLKQNYDIPGSLPKEIYSKLSDSDRAVMGYCSIPPKDEFERIDIKAGYEVLPKI